jgi:hypothetical protein
MPPPLRTTVAYEVTPPRSGFGQNGTASDVFAGAFAGLTRQHTGALFVDGRFPTLVTKRELLEQV